YKHSKVISIVYKESTKIIIVTYEDAIKKQKNNHIAKTIVGSILVKTAIQVGDPNFGRFVTAIGYADNTISPNNVDVWLCDHLIVKQGMPVPFDALDFKVIMEQETIVIKAKVGNGLFKSTAYGCNLSYEYVQVQ